MRFSLRLLVVAALVAAGCGSDSSSNQTPSDLSMTPNVGNSGVDVPVVINGNGFLVKPPGTNGGPLDTTHHAWLGSTELTNVEWQSTTSLNATVPAAIQPGSYDLVVENALGTRGSARGAYTVLPAAPFSASLTSERSTVNTDQQFTMTLVLTNNTAASITNITPPTLTINGSDGASGTIRSGPTPAAPSTLAAGASATLTWSIQAGTGAGTLSMTVSATGTTNGASITAAPPAPTTVTVQRPGALSAHLTASATTPQTVGQTVTMTLTLTNAAGTASAVVTAVNTTISANPPAGASCTNVAPAASAEAPVRIAGGASATFTWTCTATGDGSFTAGANVIAADANSGASVSPTVTGVTLTFVQAAYPINVTVTGNGAVLFPNGLSCTSTCSPTFPYGSSVTVTASPGANYIFASWGGACSGSNTTCTLNVTAARNVTATFGLAPETLTITQSANGGFLCSANGGAAGQCSNSYPYGTSLRITANPTGSVFTAWSGDCAGQPLTGCNLVMTQARSVSGTFALQADMEAGTTAFTPAQPSGVQPGAGTSVSGKAVCTNHGPSPASNAVCEVLGIPAGGTSTCLPSTTVTSLAAGSAIVCDISYVQPPLATTITVNARSDTPPPSPDPTPNTATWP